MLDVEICMSFIGLVLHANIYFYFFKFSSLVSSRAHRVLKLLAVVLVTLPQIFRVGGGGGGSFPFLVFVGVFFSFSFLLLCSFIFLFFYYYYFFLIGWLVGFFFSHFG